MGTVRQIIAKAVCASGNRRFVRTHVLKPDHCPEEILGCRVGSHHYTARSFEKSVVINGDYDVTMWYTFQEGARTNLIKQSFKYTATVPVEEAEGRLERDEEVLVTEQVEPTPTAWRIAGENLEVEVETVFTVELLGEAKLTVVAYPPEVLRVNGYGEGTGVWPEEVQIDAVGNSEAETIESINSEVMG